MIALWLAERAAGNPAGYVSDLTPYALNWQRSIRAIGGFWTGDFTIGADTMSRADMETFFASALGRHVIENTLGMTTWEGEIVEMILTKGGLAYRITMAPEHWHNKVKVMYTYPTLSDSEQGNLAYDPIPSSFHDDAQDFSDWETLAPGDKVYMIRVMNDDDSVRTGYLGEAFNADHKIEVFKDVEGAVNGWDLPVGGKTPISYKVQLVTAAGTPQSTAWLEDTDSSDIYGESLYIDVIGEVYSAAAVAVRNRRLTEFSFPRSFPVVSPVERDPTSDSLYVLCAGYVFGMNRRYRESDTAPAGLSDHIATLVGESEFVVAGTIETNALSTPISASIIPIRLWDAVEELIEIGDASGNRWVGGVLQDKKFNYSLAETEVTHFWRDGKLTDRSGVPMIPSLILPDIIVEMESPVRWALPGAAAWDDPLRVYIEEVEFIAPDRYRLIPYVAGRV